MYSTTQQAEEEYQLEGDECLYTCMMEFVDRGSNDVLTMLQLLADMRRSLRDGEIDQDEVHYLHEHLRNVLTYLIDDFGDADARIVWEE